MTTRIGHRETYTRAKEYFCSLNARAMFIHKLFHADNLLRTLMCGCHGN